MTSKIKHYNSLSHKVKVPKTITTSRERIFEEKEEISQPKEDKSTIDIFGVDEDDFGLRANDGLLLDELPPKLS